MNACDCWDVAYSFIKNHDHEKAIALCESESCSESLNCQRYLGWTYYGKSELEKAIYWFSKAADQKDGESLFGIGSVYLVRKDFQSAIQYLERAAINDYPRAYQWIGSIYHRGSGVPIDIDKAIKYYKLGVAHGFIMAERSLIHLESAQGNFLVKFISLLRFIRLLVKTAKISMSKNNDPRMVDVPCVSLSRNKTR